MFTDEHTLQVLAISQFAKYGTLDAAIAGSQRQTSAGDAVVASKEIAGASVEAVDFSDTDATFRLSNSRSICLSATADGVEWSVVNSVESEERMRELAPRRLLLQYRHQSKPLVWERADILQRRVNHDFVRIVRSDRNLFFYADKCPPLLFCVLAVDGAGPQSLLLSWNEVD